MSKSFLLGVGTAAVAAGVGLWHQNRLSIAADVPLELKRAPPESAPICPWREPEADLKRLFPHATRYEARTCILSGLRLELAERLGRPPTGDENALRLYQAYRDDTPLGFVMTRRVKGDHGAIELVLAVDAQQSVSSLHLQRWREPEAVAQALQDPAWLAAFSGKNAGSPCRIGEDLPAVRPAARASAQAIAEGVHSLLVLLALAQGPDSLSTPSHH